MASEGHSPGSTSAPFYRLPEVRTPPSPVHRAMNVHSKPRDVTVNERLRDILRREGQLANTEKLAKGKELQSNVLLELVYQCLTQRAKEIGALFLREASPDTALVDRVVQMTLEFTKGTQEGHEVAQEAVKLEAFRSETKEFTKRMAKVWVDRLILQNTRTEQRNLSLDLERAASNLFKLDDMLVSLSNRIEGSSSTEERLKKLEIELLVCGSAVPHSQYASTIHDLRDRVREVMQKGHRPDEKQIMIRSAEYLLDLVFKESLRRDLGNGVKRLAEAAQRRQSKPKVSKDSPSGTMNRHRRAESEDIRAPKTIRAQRNVYSPASRNITKRPHRSVEESTGEDGCSSDSGVSSSF